MSHHDNSLIRVSRRVKKKSQFKHIYANSKFKAGVKDNTDAERELKARKDFNAKEKLRVVEEH